MPNPDTENSTETFLSTCPRDCYDACGLKVKTENGKVIQVTGDTQHPVSKGRLCRKCTIGYNSIWVDTKSRLTQPLQRVGKKGDGKFVPVSWDTALTDIGSRFKNIINSSGAEKILTTHYTGTFSAIGYHFPMRFFNRLGATEVNPDSVCNLAGHVALDYVYGSSLIGFDPRTAKDSDCIVVWGGNPSTAGPHTNEHWLKPLSEKLVVIDSVRTPTAAMAALHLQPFPGSDAALAFSIMHVIEKQSLTDDSFIEANTIGWPQLNEIIQTCTPEWGERQTGVAATDIIKAAIMYAKGPSLLWLGQGFQRQPYGGNAMRACAMLPAITGNIGKPGAGFLYLNGLGQRGIDDDYLLGSSLAKNVQSISHMDLAATLEDAELSEALFCWNVNNVASSPEQTRLRNALCREDLFTVVADIFPTDTTDYADYILPAASFLESNDLIISYFNLSLSAQVKVAEPMGECRSNSDIFRGLSTKMGFIEKELHESDLEIIDILLKQTGLNENFESLKQQDTVNISAKPIIQFENLSFPTPSGKIELASQQASEDGFPLTPEPHADPRPANGRLRLLTPASPWSLNTIFGSAKKIDKHQGMAKIIVNSADAIAHNLVSGDRVIVENTTGQIELELSVSDEVLKGVAVSYKGRWPKRDVTQSNINILNPGTKADMGQSSAVQGIEINIRAAD